MTTREELHLENMCQLLLSCTPKMSGMDTLNWSKTPATSGILPAFLLLDRGLLKENLPQKKQLCLLQVPVRNPF